MADALDRLAQATPPRNDRRARELANAVRSQLASEPRGTDGDGIATRDVVDAVRAAVPRDGIVALDNGSYKLWFARHYETLREIDSLAGLDDVTRADGPLEVWSVDSAGTLSS